MTRRLTLQPVIRGFALRLVIRAVALLPWRSLRVLAVPLAWCVGSVLRVRRGHVEGAMRRAGVTDPARTARAMYLSLGRSLCEFLWIAGRPQTTLEGLVRFSRLPDGVAMPAGAPWGADARAGVGRPSEPGRGVGTIIVTAHTGNWDLVACAVAERLLPGLAVVTKRLHVSWLDRVWQDTRQRRGLRLVASHDLVHTLSQMLRAGQSIAMVIDQAPAARTSLETLPFAGAPALYDRLPAALAMRTGAPIVMALGRREADGGHRVEVPLALRPPARPTRAWVSDAMARMNECLDDFVRQYPEQWLWLHRRWKGAVGPTHKPVRV